jgi:hypothetical protein
MHLKTLVTFALLGTTIASPLHKRSLQTIQTIQASFQQASQAFNQVRQAANGLNGLGANTNIFLDTVNQAVQEVTAATNLLSSAATTPQNQDVVNANPGNVAAIATVGFTAAIDAVDQNEVNNNVVNIVNNFGQTAQNSLRAVAGKETILQQTAGALSQAASSIQILESVSDGLINALSPFVTSQNVVGQLRTIATDVNGDFYNTLGGIENAQVAAQAVPEAVPAAVPAVVQPGVVAPAIASSSAVLVAPAVSSSAVAILSVASPAPAESTGLSILNTS